jgi:hypothetical protein
VHARCAVDDGIKTALATPAQQTLHLIYIDENKTAGWRDIDIAFPGGSPECNALDVCWLTCVKTEKENGKTNFAEHHQQRQRSLLTDKNFTTIVQLLRQNQLVITGASQKILLCVMDNDAHTFLAQQRITGDGIFCICVTRYRDRRCIGLASKALRDGRNVRRLHGHSSS